MLSSVIARRCGSAIAWCGVLGCAALIAGCFRPFQIEVQQGNYLTQEVVAQLRPGMTRDQVRFLLGTPLVIDPFRTDRWDYVYTRQPANSARVESRRLSVFFKDDGLSRVDGDISSAAAKESVDASVQSTPQPEAQSEVRPQVPPEVAPEVQPAAQPRSQP